MLPATVTAQPVTNVYTYAIHKQCNGYVEAGKQHRYKGWHWFSDGLQWLSDEIAVWLPDVLPNLCALHRREVKQVIIATPRDGKGAVLLSAVNYRGELLEKAEVFHPDFYIATDSLVIQVLYSDRELAYLLANEIYDPTLDINYEPKTVVYCPKGCNWSEASQSNPVDVCANCDRTTRPEYENNWAYSRHDVN